MKAGPDIDDGAHVRTEPRAGASADASERNRNAPAQRAPADRSPAAEPPARSARSSRPDGAAVRSTAPERAAVLPPWPGGDRRRAAAPGPRWHLRAIEVFSTYLPVMLMAFLAFGTWWLIKVTPVAGDAPVVAPPRHEPDYTMNQFTVQRFAPDGPLVAQIEGDQLRHYPDTETTEIDNVRLRAIAPDGRLTRGTARRALSNSDGSEVQLIGGAEVVRETPGELPIVFRGEFLHAFLDTEQVRSHLPVTVTQGASTLHADSFYYDHADRVVRLKGRVRATLPATP